MIYIFGFTSPNRRSSVSELRISSPAEDLLSCHLRFRPIYPLPLSSLLPLLQAISLRHKPLCASRIHRIKLDFEQSFHDKLSVTPCKNNISVRYVHNGVQIDDSVQFFCGKSGQASWPERNCLWHVTQALQPDLTPDPPPTPTIRTVNVFIMGAR